MLKRSRSEKSAPFNFSQLNMKILRNYILREFLGPLLLCLGVLTFVMVLIGNLKRIADLVINKGVDIFSVIQIFIYLTPYIVTYTLPISILVAVLLYSIKKKKSCSQETAYLKTGLEDMIYQTLLQMKWKIV